MSPIRKNEPKKSIPSMTHSMNTSRNSIRKSSFKTNDSYADKNFPLLTANIEKTQNFFSAAGRALNREKMLEKNHKFFLQNDKGIAVVCEPNAGQLKAYESIEITLTVYNDICGKFQDDLKIEINGLPPKKFPISIQVTGSPIVVTPNQVGVSFKNDCPKINIGTIVKGYGPVVRNFKVSNTGPKDIELEWKIYEISNNNYTDRDYFNIGIEGSNSGNDQNNEFKINWKPIEPAPSKDIVFSIEPM